MELVLLLGAILAAIVLFAKASEGQNRSGGRKPVQHRTSVGKAGHRLRLVKTTGPNQTVASTDAPPSSAQGLAPRTSASPTSIDKLRACSVTAVPIMSQEQSDLLTALQSWASYHDVLLAPEVSLAAIFRVRHSKDRKLAYGAFATIRQKYLDILVTDQRHRPICGIEYHGSGHWQKAAAERDAVKRAAFEEAGLPFLEVRFGYDRHDVYRELDDLLGLGRRHFEKDVRTG